MNTCRVFLSAVGAAVSLIACGSSSQAVTQPTTPHAAGLRSGTPLIARADDSCAINTVYFDTDDDQLNDTTRATLTRAAACIIRGEPNAIRLQGSADPRGTEEYNLALGERRAMRVMTYLEALGVTRGIMTYSSVGEEFSTGMDENSWARDRHVSAELIVYSRLGMTNAMREELGALLSRP